MNEDPTNPEDVKLLPAVGEAGRPVAPNAMPGGVIFGSSAPRQLVDLPRDELENLAEELGLERRRFKTPQELVSAIHGRRQLIASLDRDALLDVVRWGRRPVPINATNEQLAHEILRIKSMRFDGLSERGLLALARLRGVETASAEAVPSVVKKLKKREGIFARLNRKRRAVLGSLVSNMIGEGEKTAEYQFLPPSDGGGHGAAPGGTSVGGVGAGTSVARDRSIKEEIEESGLFGGIASRVKKTADQYINQKLDEIESRIDRKLDEIDRRLAEWRDKEIANRIRILKITLWASVIVAAVSLVYSYVKVNFWDKRDAGPAGPPAIKKVDGAAGAGRDAALAQHRQAASGGAAVATRYATLPEATSSFGAVAMDGWLYVYGGHVAPTHTYHTGAVSGRFHRLNLTDGKAWEELPGGPALQGMNLAAYDGKIYRVGGMRCLNKQGEKADLHSSADVARYDPATKKWEAMPPLPEPRSSHDVAVLDGKLYVVGGWDMRGKDGDEWAKSTLYLDLTAKEAAWQSIKQPFQRRALTAAGFDGKLYVLGGFFDDESESSRRVDVYDPRAGKWAGGPELPGEARNGFAPAACAADGGLYVSVADGTLYRMADDGRGWAKVATGTPRIVHRLAAAGSRLLIIGGAAKGENSDLIEAATPAPVSDSMKSR